MGLPNAEVVIVIVFSLIVSCIANCSRLPPTAYPGPPAPDHTACPAPAAAGLRICTHTSELWKPGRPEVIPQAVVTSIFSRPKDPEQSQPPWKTVSSKAVVTVRL
ncbi:hypothetical protein B0H63DRAFT_458119 [Podospora didyma]|uniref:Secreted protein n=1 Tax=Podospora didyma TaxID=330526 RepID=A0AAE0P5K0_9PEZI|nr:hypothetical protein B0H63DRAFT_458119 [Podospora didyma]